MPRNPTSPAFKAAAAAVPETPAAQIESTGGAPLVNESPETEGEPEQTEEPEEELPSYEQLQSQLRDSREEVRRGAKISETLRQTVQELEKRLNQVEKSTISIKTTQPANRAASLPAPLALVPGENYFGPSQASIYLALVQGFTGSLDPLKLDDSRVNALADSFLGVSEVFYHRALRRRSFSINPAPVPTPTPES